MVKNIPEVIIEGVRIYNLEKLDTDKDLYKLETKLVVSVDENDELNNDIRKAFFVVKTGLLKDAFAGYKTTELKGQLVDIQIEIRPFTRMIDVKSTGKRFEKTEWYPEVLDICFSGEGFEEKEPKVPVLDEVL